MLRFRRMRSLQKFVAVHSSIHNLFNAERTLSSRDNFKARSTAALSKWRQSAQPDIGGGLGKWRPVRIGLTAPFQVLSFKPSRISVR